MRERRQLRLLTVTDARPLFDLILRNRSVIEEMEPHRSSGWWTLEGQIDRLRIATEQSREGRRQMFGLYDEGVLSGYLSLDNIVRGAWQNCTLGYLVDRKKGGRGIGSWAVRKAVAVALGSCGLHRVQAAVIPTNVASARVLEKNGFRLEGRAQRYLQIGGIWTDHDIYAITAEEWSAPS